MQRQGTEGRKPVDPSTSEDEEELQERERTPSFLTARELLARDRARAEPPEQSEERAKKKEK